jgi:hypothetical protein
MRSSYRSPCLSLRLPPGAMFSIGLLNIQKQRQSRVKGGLAKIAKQRLAISDPLGIIETPACFRRQLQTVRLHGDRVAWRTARPCAGPRGFGRRLLTTNTKLYGRKRCPRCTDFDCAAQLPRCDAQRGRANLSCGRFNSKGLSQLAVPPGPCASSEPGPAKTAAIFMGRYSLP